VELGAEQDNTGLAHIPEYTMEEGADGGLKEDWGKEQRVLGWRETESDRSIATLFVSPRLTSLL
jgi:hypothetical protein